jgi:hypothetical protein
LKKAFGIARIPVPKLPFSRWISVSVFLREENVVAHYRPSCLHVQLFAFCTLYCYHPVTLIKVYLVHVFNFMSYFIKSIQVNVTLRSRILSPPHPIPPHQGCFRNLKRNCYELYNKILLGDFNFIYICMLR